KIRDAANTWDILQSRTQIDLRELAGPKITSPANGIYMTSDDHDYFGAFKFYLDKSAASLSPRPALPAELKALT
ncbi:hypothetical protein FB451DRAFT_1019990, partial [Mycena latifolia]